MKQEQKVEFALFDALNAIKFVRDNYVEGYEKDVIELKNIIDNIVNERKM